MHILLIIKYAYNLIIDIHYKQRYCYLKHGFILRTFALDCNKINQLNQNSDVHMWYSYRFMTDLLIDIYYHVTMHSVQPFFNGIKMENQ